MTESTMQRLVVRRTYAVQTEIRSLRTGTGRGCTDAEAPRVTEDKARIELARLVEKHGLAVGIAQTATIYRGTRGSCAVPGSEAATDLQLLLTWLRAIGREPLT